MKLAHERVVIIPESYVDLAGDLVRAAILVCFIWFTKASSSREQVLKEEIKRVHDPDRIPMHGWMTVSMSRLAEESLVRQSAPTMRRHVVSLTEEKILWERNDPDPYMRSFQYRVDFVRIYERMQNTGRQAVSPFPKFLNETIGTDERPDLVKQTPDSDEVEVVQAVEDGEHGNDVKKKTARPPHDDSQLNLF